MGKDKQILELEKDKQILELEKDKEILKLKLYIKTLEIKLEIKEETEYESDEESEKDEESEEETEETELEEEKFIYGTKKCVQCNKNKPKTSEYFNKHARGFRKICIICEGKKNEKKSRATKECPTNNCNNMIYPRSKMCNSCRCISNRIVERPNREILINQLNSIQVMTKIAKKYNVSDNTIRKWNKYYKITWIQKKKKRFYK